MNTLGKITTGLLIAHGGRRRGRHRAVHARHQALPQDPLDVSSHAKEDEMTETPGEHLTEEPQSERGPMGSRDTGSDEPVGRPGRPARGPGRRRTTTRRSTRRARSTAGPTCRPATGG